MTEISGTDNTVTLTVTDADGTSVSTSFNISVVAEIPALAITSVFEDLVITGNTDGELTLADYIASITTTGGTGTIAVTQNPAAGTVISGTTNEIVLSAIDEAGESASIRFNVEVVMDETVDASVNSVDLTIYPNPTSGNLVIECSNTIQKIALIGTLGTIEERNTGNSQNVTIDLSVLNKGIYQIIVTTSNGAQTVKQISLQ